MAFDVIDKRTGRKETFDNLRSAYKSYADLRDAPNGIKGDVTLTGSKGQALRDLGPSVTKGRERYVKLDTKTLRNMVEERMKNKLFRDTPETKSAMTELARRDRIAERKEREEALKMFR